MIKTKVTELLNIERPIIQGGMQLIATPEMAAAVSNAGGLGTINMFSYPTKEEFRVGLQKVKSLTDKPFAVNMSIFPAMTPPDYMGYLQVAAEEGVKVIETAGRRPDGFVDFMHANGMINMHKCTTVRHALSAQEIGCDIIIADGIECAGHPNDKGAGSIVFTPRAVEELKVPVVACGGYANGKGLAAALMFGAEAITMGTRFLLTKESPILDSLKKYLVDNVGETDTTMIMCSFKNATRVYNSNVARTVLELEAQGATFDKVAPYVSGKKARELQFESGDIENCGTICIGESVGLVHDIPTIQELMDRTMAEAEEAIRKYAGMIG